LSADWLPATPGSALNDSRELGAAAGGGASGGTVTLGGEGTADGGGTLGGGGEEDSGILGIQSCIRLGSRGNSQAVINRPTASSHGATVQKDRKEKSPFIG